MKEHPNVNWLVYFSGYYFGEDEIGFVRYKDKLERIESDLGAYAIQTIFETSVQNGTRQYIEQNIHQYD